jgi:hypothetical protein
MHKTQKWGVQINIALCSKWIPIKSLKQLILCYSFTFLQTKHAFLHNPVTTSYRENAVGAQWLFAGLGLHLQFHKPISVSCYVSSFLHRISEYSNNLLISCLWVFKSRWRNKMALEICKINEFKTFYNLWQVIYT